MVEAMPINSVTDFLDRSFILGTPDRPEDMLLFSDSRGGLDRFIEVINHTKPGNYNTAVPTSVVKVIANVLRSNPRLLKVEFGDCDTLWRWLVKNDYFRICLLISSLNKGNRFEIPINAVDPITGDSVVTDHRFIPSPKMLHMLILIGESMDFHNVKTIENMLHVLVKQRPGNPDSNTAYYLLKSIVKICETIENPDFSYLNNLPDIDLPNYQDKSPLQIALESEWMEMAELLVEKLGADFNYVSCASLPEISVNYVEKCRYLYTIKSNVTKIGEYEKECRVCSETMEPSEAYRMVGCCKKIMHSECLRKYLNRTNSPTCIFCNVSKFEEEVLAAIPNTVFKRRWPRTRTYSDTVTASETTENASDFLKEIVVTHEDLSRVLQWHIPSAEYEHSEIINDERENDSDELDHSITNLLHHGHVPASMSGWYPESGIRFFSFIDSQNAEASPSELFSVSFNGQQHHHIRPNHTMISPQPRYIPLSVPLPSQNLRQSNHQQVLETRRHRSRFQYPQFQHRSSAGGYTQPETPNQRVRRVNPSAVEAPRPTPVAIFGSYGIDGVTRLSPYTEQTHRYSTIRMEDHIVYLSMVKNFEIENMFITNARIYRQYYSSTITSPETYKCITDEKMTRLLLNINGLVETANIRNSDGFDRFVQGISSCIADSCFRPSNNDLARDKLKQYISRSLIERAQRNILIRVLRTYQEREFMDRLREANTISSFSRSVWLRFREEHVSNNCAISRLLHSILLIGPIVEGSDHERICSNWVDDMMKVLSLVLSVVEILVQ